jgi:manganese/zinc/iron transport system substrate-binding protein
MATVGGGSEAIRVVATTGQVADLARQVGGERVSVESLMGPGVDPHLYRASEGDVSRLSEADLILYNGLRLEGKMEDLLARLGEQRPVVAVTDGIDPVALRTDPTAPEHPDPHVWFDPILWAQTGGVVAEALAELRPEHADEFRANAERYAEELAALDAEATEALAAIPAERRVLVTAHDAFGYFGARYDVDVVGLQGISTESEAGIADVTRIADLIADRGVKAIFVETSVSPRTIEAVQAAVEDRGGEVAIGGSLFSDALGEPGTPEETYLGMFRRNLTTIVEALS